MRNDCNGLYGNISTFAVPLLYVLDDNEGEDTVWTTDIIELIKL